MLILILLLVLIFGFGGGHYATGSPVYGGGIGLGSVLVILLVLYMLGMIGHR